MQQFGSFFSSYLICILANMMCGQAKQELCCRVLPITPTCSVSLGVSFPEQILFPVSPLNPQLTDFSTCSYFWQKGLICLSQSCREDSLGGRKAFIHIISFYMYKKEEGHLNSIFSLKRSSKYTMPCWGWYAFLHHSIALNSKHSFQGLVKPDFLLCGCLLHSFRSPLPFILCLIPKFTLKFRMQQGSSCHVTRLPVRPSKSASSPCVNTSLSYLIQYMAVQSVFALPEGVILQFVIRTAKKSRLQIPDASTWLPPLLQSSWLVELVLARCHSFRNNWYWQWQTRSSTACLPWTQSTVKPWTRGYTVSLCMSKGYRCKGRLEDKERSPE